MPADPSAEIADLIDQTRDSVGDDVAAITDHVVTMLLVFAAAGDPVAARLLTELGAYGIERDLTPDDD
jgi:hypothetical protein